MITLEKVKTTAEMLKEVVIKTDLIKTSGISEGKELYLKAENLQVTGSFKVRGAYGKIAGLTDEQKARGVVACSAGNHAQGVALAAKQRNIEATIFIPSTAPITKIEATRSFGANVELVDGVYDDAYDEAMKFQKAANAVFIHPFNDEDVITGQGSIALEIFEQLPDVEAIVVPIGGGGLIAGIAATAKMLNPNCKVYGVQAEGAAAMYLSFKRDNLTEVPTVSTFADGTAVKHPGDLTFEYCKKFVDDIVTVTDDETATAVLTLMERQKLVAEGSGALSVAAVMFDKLPVNGKKTVCVVSGGNIDVNILSRVINRGLLKTGRLCDLTIELTDKPGELQQVSTIIAHTGANVIRVRHNRGGAGTDINGCYLKISMETKNKQHFDEVRNKLIQAGYKVTTVV